VQSNFLTHTHHTHKHTHARAHTHTHMRAHTHTHTYTPGHTHTHTYTHGHTHTYTHGHTHTHSHTEAQTHTRKHTCSVDPILIRYEYLWEQRWPHFCVTYFLVDGQLLNAYAAAYIIHLQAISGMGKLGNQCTCVTVNNLVGWRSVPPSRHQRQSNLLVSFHLHFVIATVLECCIIETKSNN
jgi:hypothetical protein